MADENYGLRPKSGVAVEVNWNYNDAFKVQRDLCKLIDLKNGYIEGVHFAYGRCQELLLAVQAGLGSAFSEFAPRLKKMKLEEDGMGFHAFKRFRKTQLRVARCLEDLNNFWMAHKPKTVSELYSHLHEKLELRLAESGRVFYGFILSGATASTVAPNAPKLKSVGGVQIAA